MISLYTGIMKNPTLQDVLTRRAQIKTQLASLNEEDQELATAEKVLLRLAGLTEPPSFPILPLPSVPMPPLSVAPIPPPPPWVKAATATVVQAPPPRDVDIDEEEEDEEPPRVLDLVRGMMKGNETLEQLTLMLFENCSDVWWTAIEIQTHLSSLRGKEVPMGSISPMLTALKNAGTIVRKGHDVALATKPAEEITR